MGRKAKQIFHNGRLLYFTDGQTTIRVSEDKTNSLFVLFQDTKRITTRRHKEEIAEEFFKLVDKDRWVELEQNTRPVLTLSPEEINSALESQGEIEFTIDTQGNISATDLVKLSTADICKLFRTIYDKDPLKAETLSGITNLSKLQTIDWNYHTTSSSLTIENLLTCHKTRIERDGTIKDKNKIRYIREAENWLGEFQEVISSAAGKKITLVSDITKEYLIRYINELCKVASQPDYKNKCKWLSDEQKRTLTPPYPKKTWIRQRKSKLITIFTDYIEENYLDANSYEYILLTNLLTILRGSKALKKLAVKPKAKPMAVDVETFHKLYNSANLRWKCYLTLAVNCGFTFSEISDLEKKDLSLDKCEMIQTRPKTGEFRAAKLHPLTCSLLNQYQAEYNDTNDTDYFFVGRSHKKLHPDSCRDYFRELREKTDTDKAISFKRLRKCVATVATQKGCNEVQVRLLMGHTLNGELGAYVENCVETVAPACSAVCSKYFDGLEPPLAF